MTVNDLYDKAQQIAPWMVETRRALHRIPENGFQEFKTQALLMHQLTAMGIPPREAEWAGRFSLSPHTTDEEIDYAAGRIGVQYDLLRCNLYLTLNHEP